MTKDEIENIVKRYKYIDKAINGGVNEIIIYIGKRKHSLFITHETIMVCEIIKEIKSRRRVDWVNNMINGILQGHTDMWLIANLPCERTMYYNIKRNFINLVYNCCIAKGLVSYEELLRENIA